MREEERKREGNLSHINRKRGKQKAAKGADPRGRKGEGRDVAKVLI